MQNVERWARTLVLVLLRAHVIETIVTAEFFDVFCLFTWFPNRSEVARSLRVALWTQFFTDAHYLTLYIPRYSS